MSNKYFLLKILSLLRIDLFGAIHGLMPPYLIFVIDTANNEISYSHNLTKEKICINDVITSVLFTRN